MLSHWSLVRNIVISLVACKEPSKCSIIRRNYTLCRVKACCRRSGSSAKETNKFGRRCLRLLEILFDFSCHSPQAMHNCCIEKMWLYSLSVWTKTFVGMVWYNCWILSCCERLASRRRFRRTTTIYLTDAEALLFAIRPTVDPVLEEIENKRILSRVDEVNNIYEERN